MHVATQAGTNSKPLWTQTSRSVVAYVCQPRSEHHLNAQFAESHERLMAFVEYPGWDEVQDRTPETGWPSVVAKEGSD
jgi:hypothetical protein